MRNGVTANGSLHAHVVSLVWKQWSKLLFVRAFVDYWTTMRSGGDDGGSGGVACEMTVTKRCDVLKWHWIIVGKTVGEEKLYKTVMRSVEVKAVCERWKWKNDGIVSSGVGVFPTSLYGIIKHFSLMLEFISALRPDKAPWSIAF